MATMKEYIIEAKEGCFGTGTLQGELVRCGDCTRYEKKNGRCNLAEGLNVATANSFCSYGERKE